MSETSRKFFIDSVSGTTVQLRPVPGQDAHPGTEPGIALHQVNLVTGVTAAANADTAFWQTNCHRYEVIIRRTT